MAEEICVVTGGRGFVGRRLVLKLLEAGEWEVRIVDICPEVSLDEAEKNDGLLTGALASGRAKYVKADITVYEQIADVVKGSSVVFHMAAPNPLRNDYNLQYAVSVNGTRNVIQACVEHGVKKLIYTSSASVVFDGLHNIKNGDESLPYPEKAMDTYGETKAMAEKLVLEANGREGLLTVSLRPSGIFGPGDTLFVPKTIKTAVSGRLKFVIGSGENMMDFTYVDNVAHAHICAEKALVLSAGEDSDASGKAYFITNGEPRKFWDFLFGLATGLGYGPPKLKLPAGFIILLAHIYQFVVKYLQPLGVVPSTDFSPSVIRISTRWRTFSCARAAKLLGYAPPIPLEEGVKRTIVAFSHLRKEVMLPPKGPKPVREISASKAHSALGGGKAANVLLWANKGETFGLLASLLGLYYVLFASGWTLVSLWASLLGWAIFLAFVYIKVQPQVKSLIGYELPDISSCWELPEAPFEILIGGLGYFWNNYVLEVLQQLAEDRGLWYLGKVVLSILLFKFLFGSFHFSTVLVLAICLIFSLPKAYELHEEDLDKATAAAVEKMVEIRKRGLEKVGDMKVLIVSKLPKKFQKKQD